MAVKVLDAFNFEDGEDEKRIKGFYKYLEKPDIVNPIIVYNFNTTKDSETMGQIISDIKKSILEFGKDLGFDLGKRISTVNKVIFTKQSDLTKKVDPSGVVEKYLLDRHFTGHYSSETSRIYVSIDRKDGSIRGFDELAASVNHEFIHAISYKLIVFNKANEFYTKRGGLCHEKKYYILDECVVTLTAFYLMRFYWYRYDGLRDLAFEASKRMPYGTGILVDEIIGKIASKEKTSYKNILNFTQRDFIEGTNNIFILVEKYFGKKVLDDISELRQMSLDEINGFIKKAKKYGLEDMVEKLNAYKNDGKFRFLQNVRLKRKI